MKVSLHLTQNCNLRCSYCYGGEKSTVSMSEAVANKAIDFVFHEITDSYLALTFFGGEPLLKYALIEKVVASIQKKKNQNVKVRYAVNTNGTILTPRVARFLFENHFYIFLSLDGDRVTHDTHRVFPNQEGSFRVVEKNLEAFLKINPYLVTLSVITPENVDYVKDSVSFLVKKGIRLIMVTPDYTAPWDKKSFNRLKKAYKKVANLYLKLHRQRRKIFLNIIDERIRTHIEQERPKNVCNFADSEFSIAPDGTIFPCIQFINARTIRTKEWAIGHVDEGWYEGERKKIIEQSGQLPDECYACALNGRCMNYCGCLNVRTTGKVNEVSPFRCTHERMLFPIVDNVGNTLFQEKNDLFLQKFYNPHFSVLSVLEDGVL